MISSVLALILGVLAGAALCYLIFFSFAKNTETTLRANLAHEKEDKERLAGEKTALEGRVLSLEKESSAVAAEKRGLEERIKAHQSELEGLRQNLSEHFQNLAGQILEKNSKKFLESSGHSLAALLNPLRDRILEFQKKVEDTHTQGVSDRAVLKNEIEKMVSANQKISEDANNLTKALTGDSKVQGDWGEIALSRILESSGLREGSEYVVQAEGLGLSAEDGGRRKPDVIINLPEDKHVIIDSKVTLTSYQRFVATGGKKELKEFHDSLYAHIDGLSQKHYQSLGKLNSPDFVLMFVPIEAVFAAAMQTDAEIFPYAWDKRIVAVSPTTLFATLRTVAAIWRTERQNKNALKIAEEGGKLYDKFVSFLKDLEEIGKSLADAQEKYEGAKNKLRTGPGNLITRTEKLKTLGAKTSKEIPSDYIEEPGETRQLPR